MPHSDKPYRVAMIGVGDITMLHRPAYVDCADAELALLCDADPALLARRAAAWNVPRTTADYRAVLADPDIDIVEINTPHHLHKRMVVEALEAGKHVACQKPIATSIADAEAMVAAAERSGAKLRVLENFVFYPPYVRAKEMLDAGEIGEVLAVRFKLGTGLFGSRWVPLRSELWHLTESERGMGQAVFDDGYHKLSLAVHLVGAIEAVQGFIDRTFAFIDEPAQLLWTYKDRATLGSFDIAFSPNLYTHSKYFPADERIDIAGSKGTIRLRGCTGAITDEAPLTVYRHGRREEHDDLETDWQASFSAGIRDFPRALRAGRDTLLTGRRALEVLRFAYAAIVAAKIGERVRPDEMTDEIVARHLRGPEAAS